MGRKSTKVSVEIGGKVVEMQQRVYSLYLLLVANRNTPVDADVLCGKLNITMNSLRVAMVSLRRAVAGVYRVVMDRASVSYCMVPEQPEV